LTYTYSRLQFGQRGYNPTSRFIADMGDGLSTSDSHPSFLGQRQVADDEPFYSDELGFDIGDQVTSSVFGDGEIIDIDGMAVTVAFLSGQTKKLNAEFARLQKR
jgi:DNA helicase-2/ATP-dependent DNA helicase PcrA